MAPVSPAGDVTSPLGYPLLLSDSYYGYHTEDRRWYNVPGIVTLRNVALNLSRYSALSFRSEYSNIDSTIRPLDSLTGLGLRRGPQSCPNPPLLTP